MVAQVKPVQYKAHEVANLFPLMSDEEFADLKADIEKHGLREPIWLFDGKILDGRNRHRACLETSVEPRFRHYVDDNNLGTLIAFVKSQNYHRRHLSSSQKAMVAAATKSLLSKAAKERQIAALKKGNTAPVQEIFPKREKGSAREQAAKIEGTNAHYVSDAERILAKAPEVAERVKSGKMNIPDGKALAELDEKNRKTALQVLDNGGAKNGRKAAAMVLRATTPIKESASDDSPAFTKPRPKPLVDLEGRKPEEFAASTRAQGETERLYCVALQTPADVVVRGAFEYEKPDLKKYASTLIPWLQEIERSC